jgi:hypothetical protein
VADLNDTNQIEKQAVSSSASQLLKKLGDSEKKSPRGRFSNLQDGLARIMGSVRKIAMQFKSALGYIPGPGVKPAAGLGLGGSRAKKEEDQDGD